MFLAVEVIDTLLCNNSVAFHLNGVATHNMYKMASFKLIQNEREKHKLPLKQQLPNPPQMKEEEEEEDISFAMKAYPT